ncbi:glycosyltransferase [Paenibacillus piscarius]|uniref:glycosyltransferase n=1 Tax=Paenibacillus piscarius TaxID=1089681 RepID=UPI001EE88003|nr:glycosyltransferase [Paenibacillus piscarius]
MSYDSRMYKKNSVFLSENAGSDGLDLAIVLVTTEGIQHKSGGIAKYFRSFIETVVEMRHQFCNLSINLTLYACEPALLTAVPTYSRENYDQLKELLESTGGAFFKLVNNTYGQDWIGSVENWKLFSASAATVALNLAEKHQATLVITGSSCLALTHVYIHKQLKAFKADIRTIHMTHDSAFSTFHKERNENILSMDYLAAQWTKFSPNAKIGYVSQYMKDLFKMHYMVPEDGFIPAKGGVLFGEERFKALSDAQIIRLLQKYQIPIDKQVIFSWGRPVDYKRLDLVFRASKYLPEDIFPVAVTNGIYSALQEYLKANSLRGLLIEKYKDFELINALLHWKNTVCTCLLSENEPGAIVPMEAMYMAQGHNNVIIANSNGIYKELIQEGINGFTIESDPAQLAEKILQINAMSNEQLREINKKAYTTICQHFGQKKFIIETLCAAVPQIHAHSKRLINYIEEAEGGGI